jgi:hypothetical protein
MSSDVFSRLAGGLPSAAGNAVVYTPPAMGAVNRWYFARPLQLDPQAAQGLWCPMGDHALDRGPDGWRCMAPSCWAGWDWQGRRGWWIGDAAASVDAAAVARRRLDRRIAAAVATVTIAGLGLFTGHEMRPWAGVLPAAVLWPIAGGLAVLMVLAAGIGVLVRRVRAWWPYRHNRVLGQFRAGNAGDGGVRDGR